MKQQHSLDHDGLDGILQLSIKPKSKFFYFRLFWLVPILIIIASATFWLQKNRQTYPRQSPAELGSLPYSPDKTTVVENESPTSSVPAQNAQPSISGQSGNVSLPSPSPTEPTLSNNIHSVQSPVALENQVLHARESAQAETATTQKPPVIEPVTTANSQKDQNQSTEPLMNNNIKVNFRLASSEVNLARTERTGLTRLVEKCDNQILITGYTCNVGSPDHNQKLGLARANALKRLLISNGVPAERIITASKGMQSPIASNETISGRALNRRAELTCKGKS